VAFVDKGHLEKELAPVVVPGDFDLYEYGWDEFKKKYLMIGMEKTTDAWYGHEYVQR
jgi:hypothetical protein